MITKYKTGLEKKMFRCYSSLIYPDEDMCIWKLSYETEVAMADGRARHCQLYCNGLQKTCDCYYPLKDLNEVKQI